MTGNRVSWGTNLKPKNPASLASKKYTACKNKSVLDEHATDKKVLIFSHMGLGLKFLELRY